jgi:hypothetical protein
VNTSIRRAEGIISTSSPGIISTLKPKRRPSAARLADQLTLGKVGEKPRLRLFEQSRETIDDAQAQAVKVT